MTEKSQQCTTVPNSTSVLSGKTRAKIPVYPAALFSSWDPKIIDPVILFSMVHRDPRSKMEFFMRFNLIMGPSWRPMTNTL